MDTKDRYSGMFLNAAGLTVSSEELKRVRPVWWYNTREKNQGGLRLTDNGLDFIINEADIKVYEIELNKDMSMTPQVIVWLDQFLESPFHIGKRKLTVLSEKAAFEIYLFAGDVRKMGQSKAMARRLSQNLNTN
jgi:hypothetical protein